MAVVKLQDKEYKLWATVKNGRVEIFGDAAGLKELGEVCLALSSVPNADVNSRKECGHYEFDDVYFNIEEGSASFTIARALGD